MCSHTGVLSHHGQRQAPLVGLLAPLMVSLATPAAAAVVVEVSGGPNVLALGDSGLGTIGDVNDIDVWQLPEVAVGDAPLLFLILDDSQAQGGGDPEIRILDAAAGELEFDHSNGNGSASVIAGLALTPGLNTVRVEIRDDPVNPLLQNYRVIFHLADPEDVVDEVEPNDTRATGGVLPTLPGDLAVVVRGAVRTPDIDYYRFAVPEGAWVTILGDDDIDRDLVYIDTELSLHRGVDPTRIAEGNNVAEANGNGVKPYQALMVGGEILTLGVGDGVGAAVRQGVYQVAVLSDLGFIGFCGDGDETGDEECDDGNAVANDGCSPDCEIREIIVDPPADGGDQEDGGPAGDPGPGDPGPGDTGPGDTGAGDPGPGDIGSGDPEPGDTAGDDGDGAVDGDGDSTKKKSKPSSGCSCSDSAPPPSFLFVFLFLAALRRRTFSR